MANSHQQYSHPGPSYYHSPPPPPQYYNHAVPYYQYPMNPMNGHSPPPHQPVSPRMNGTGRGGYHPHRAGGPSYQHFPHVSHPQHYLPQTISPASASPPAAYPHPPPPQKYNPHAHHVPYSQPYHHHAPNGHYASNSWSTQTLSPLPKQLSMPAQLPSPLPPADDSPVPPPHREPLPESEPITSSQAEPHAPSTFLQQESINPIPPASSSPYSPPLNQYQQQQLPSSPHTGNEAVLRSPTPQSPVSVGSAAIRAMTSQSVYVVWSRRPRNPSRAAGVMISSLARPPSNVMEGAADARTPPTSPKPPPVSLNRSGPAIAAETDSAKGILPPAVEANEDPSSSSVAETTTNSTAPVTPTAGTPSATSTSVTSAAPSPVQQAKPLHVPAVTEVKAAEEMKTDSSAENSVSGAQQPVIVNNEVTPSVAAPTQIPHVDAKPAPPPQKKSWASLLQPTDSGASSSKSRLPTSTVVGFSIPAGLQNGSTSPSSSQPKTGAVRPEVLNLLNIGPSGLSPAPKIRPRGLINTGNMCFANAVLQVLVYCPPFYRLFTELGKYLPGPGAQHNSAATPLVDATIQFVKEFGPKQVEEKHSRSKGKEREEDFDDLDSFIPTNIYDVLKEKKRFETMVGGHQEDAEEFLGFFLDTLEEELLSLTSGSSKTTDDHADQPSTDAGWLEVTKRNRAVTTRTTKTADSPITRIFGGKFRSTLKAPHQRDSVTIEDWRSLRLDIQRDTVSTIKDALQSIPQPHPVEISAPTRPGVVIEATRQELVESLPPILVLHLKRFLYDTKVCDVVKLGKNVTFGPELEIGPDLLAKRPAQPIKYRLIGALYHHGQSASGGHYTLDVLHPNRDLNDKPRPAWIRIDDELVSDMRAEDVFGGQERDDRCAYLLFYQRIGPGVQTKTWSQTAK